MVKPKQIGITGGIGAGKSVICRIFQALGAPVYNADERAKYLMSHDKKLIRNISASFGEQSYFKEGQLNRHYLAAEVFRNPVKVQTLNKLVHPAVARDYKKWVKEHISGSPYLIKEAALMIESGSYQTLDYLVVVVAPLELRISRVLQRDPHRKRQQVLDIIANQLSDEERMEKSHFTIQNDQNHLVIPQVLRLHEKFKASKVTRDSPAG